MGGSVGISAGLSVAVGVWLAGKGVDVATTALVTVGTNVKVNDSVASMAGKVAVMVLSWVMTGVMAGVMAVAMATDWPGADESNTLTVSKIRMNMGV